MAVVEMTYGEYSFTPVPMVTLGKEFIKTGGDTVIGTTFTVSLKGTLVSYALGGLVNMSALQQEMRKKIDIDGLLFLLTCDGTDILRCYPRIKAINFDTSNDNWVFTCPYTIELEFDDEFSLEGCSFDISFDESFDTCADILTELRYNPYIRELGESWDIEFADDKSYYRELLPNAQYDENPVFLRLTHSINAVGKAHYASGGLSMPAWQQARAAVIPLLGYDATRVSNSGIFNIDISNYGAYNHMRTNTTDIGGGSFSVNETWLVANTGADIPAVAMEDFTIDVKNGIDNDRNTVSIQGNIQGLESRTYGASPNSFDITKTKYESAKEYWAAVQSRLYYRCGHAVAGYGGRSLNLNSISSSVGHQWANGIITYSYEYDNRPSNCVPGALSESVTVTDSNPVDIFASIQVIGRGNGPILQNMNTVTSATREVSVEVTMPAGTGCLTDGTVALLATNPRTAVYNNLITGIYLDLVETYASGNVYKHQDTESWNPKEGRYTRNIAWTMSDCTG